MAYDLLALRAVRTLLYRPWQGVVFIERERNEEDTMLRRFQHLGL